MTIEVVVQGAIHSGRSFALLLKSSNLVQMTLTMKVEGSDRPFTLICPWAGRHQADTLPIVVDGRLNCEITQWGSARLGALIEVFAEAGPYRDNDSGTVIVAAPAGA